ncbi:unnamed protein product [Caenorhabditis auriculariae]|uniref:Uncharacterized protein n=1 Tax=Caenorhabditis auriculariae TaxID=2777116 RepID=A0A8S1HUM6_9PELO|nr:unnamed protein product [Caenorhabditis auriculariae]
MLSPAMLKVSLSRRCSHQPPGYEDKRCLRKSSDEEEVHYTTERRRSTSSIIVIDPADQAKLNRRCSSTKQQPFRPRQVSRVACVGGKATRRGFRHSCSLSHVWQPVDR